MKINPKLIPASLVLFLAIATVTIPAAYAAKGPQPSICKRSCWGARAPQSGISQMSGLSRAVVHHTASTTDYNTSSITTSKANVRGAQNLHMDVNGWSDIGYHFLVDKLGNTFEGRSGSMSSLPRGAHDSVNFKSFGFNVMGYMHPPYNNSPTAAMRNALYSVVAWRMPSSWSPYGSGSYGGGTVGHVAGHRNVFSTACPGDTMFAYIGNNYSGGDMRNQVNAIKNGGGGGGLKQDVYIFGRSLAGDCLYRRWNVNTGWADWGNLAGDIVNGPSGYSRGPDHFGVVTRRASTNNIQIRNWTSSNGWYSWTDLGGPLASGPSVTPRGDYKVHVAARGQDDAVWITTKIDGQGWQNWYSIGGDTDGRPSIYSKGEDHIGVVAFFGNPGTIKVANYTSSNGWYPWAEVDGSQNMVSSPAGVVRGDKVDVFARRSDGHCCVQTHTAGQGWKSGWYSLGAPPGGMVDAPTAFSRGPDHVAVVVRNGNDRYHKKNWTAEDGWGEWHSLGNADVGLVSSPGSAAR